MHSSKEIPANNLGLQKYQDIFALIFHQFALSSGVARGTGWQHIGAYVNLGAYYIVGIPLASVLCFVLNLRGKGLWIGIMIGSAVQAIVLAIITVTTNWRKQVSSSFHSFFNKCLFL